MVIFTKFKNFIQDLDEKQFYTYLAAYIGSIVLLMSLLMFMHYRKVYTLKKKISRINNNRRAAQDILSTYERVKQQKAYVAAMLEKDKNFKIVGYIDSVLANLNLTSNRSSYTQNAEAKESLPEYTEIRLVIHLVDLNMRQLVELLHEIEKNERIYTKELEIMRSTTKPAIDVTLTVATLQERTQGTETE